MDNNWIPVTDGLPETDDNVWVTYRSGEIGIDYVANDTGVWQWEDRSTGFEVTAWQPLPEPYKGE